LLFLSFNNNYFDDDDDYDDFNNADPDFQPSYRNSKRFDNPSKRKIEQLKEEFDSLAIKQQEKSMNILRQDIEKYDDFLVNLRARIEEKKIK